MDTTDLKKREIDPITPYTRLVSVEDALSPNIKDENQDTFLG
jgi:hypothetical protein